MKSLNKSEIKKQIKQSIIFDKYELPIILMGNLKTELVNVLKKYVKVSEKDVSFSVKIINGEKYKIEVNCLSNGFFIKQ